MDSPSPLTFRKRATIEVGPENLSTHSSSERSVPNVRFKISNFRFEMTSLSDFEIPHFPDSQSVVATPAA